MQSRTAEVGNLPRELEVEAGEIVKFTYPPYPTTVVRDCEILVRIAPARSARLIRSIVRSVGTRSFARSYFPNFLRRGYFRELGERLSASVWEVNLVVENSIAHYFFDLVESVLPGNSIQMD